MTDRRRYGVIEVRRLNANTYHLTINGELWSEVEWSALRQRWCIQDAAHHDPSTVVEYVVGGGRELFGRNTMTAMCQIHALSAKILCFSR